MLKWAGLGWWLGPSGQRVDSRKLKGEHGMACGRGLFPCTTWGTGLKFISMGKMNRVFYLILRSAPRGVQGYVYQHAFLSMASPNEINDILRADSMRVGILRHCSGQGAHSTLQAIWRVHVKRYLLWWVRHTLRYSIFYGGCDPPYATVGRK